MVFFEKCFRFPNLDIFKNVQNPFPFLLFEKSLLLENIVKILVKICEHIHSHILIIIKSRFSPSKPIQF
jgi:hypothetical protein